MSDLCSRMGVMRDRLSVAADGVLPLSTYGSRTESRAYFGFGARFGNLILTAVEGIELDREPYELSWVHDKGFLAAQMTF